MLKGCVKCGSFSWEQRSSTGSSVYHNCALIVYNNPNTASIYNTVLYEVRLEFLNQESLLFRDSGNELSGHY